ncbi:MAG: glycosyltransferase [Coriobacteriia bacterium]
MATNRVGAPAPLNWHVDFIVRLAALLRPCVYVELGLYQCELFNQVIPFAEQLVGVDAGPASGEYMEPAPNARFVCATTQDFARQLHESPMSIDMLFIDADHSRESVLRDFKDYFSFVSPHGIVLLHDSHPGDAELTQPGYCGTGYQAVEELSRDTSEYEMMTIPISPGLTLCRKRASQLSWMEGEVASLSPVPIAPEKQFRIVCIAQVYNELRKGNLERFVDHVIPLVDALVVYDDGSTDGTYEYMLGRTPHVIRGVHNDFANEISHKQVLLDRALQLAPDFILWLDADEVLATEDRERLQQVCGWSAAHGIDGVQLHEVNIWRSDSWRRLDSLFDLGWFVRLWRVMPGMGYEVAGPGLHQAQYPSTIQRIEKSGDLGVLHYGFANERNLSHKYLVYRRHGQRGYDMLDRLVSEERLDLERVPAELFPADLRRDDPPPGPLSFEESLSFVERYREEVFRPGFSIISLVYKSVDWAKFVHRQVLRHTDMRDKEFLFVANDASDEVLEYLRDNYLPHVVWKNTPEQQAEWYINNVYRAYNFGAQQARGDVLVFINTDMAFSPRWLESLWAGYDGSNCVVSRLVESGKLRSGQYGIERDFGTEAEEYDEAAFLGFAGSVAEDRVADDGLYMPLLVRRDRFLEVGGYPEGNIQPESDLLAPVITRQGEPCITGDKVLIDKLRSRSIRHQTVFSSVVYHFQEGEKDSAPIPGEQSRPKVAICNDIVTGSMGERVLWDFMLESLPSSIGVDTRVVGLNDDYARLAGSYIQETLQSIEVIIQNATFIGTVDPSRYTVAFLQDNLRAMGRDTSQQEENMRAARRLVTNSIQTAISYPEYDFDIISVGVDSDLFRPIERAPLREELGFGDERIGIFVGSFDEVKGWSSVEACVRMYPDITWILVTKKDESFEAPNARVYSRIPQELLVKLLNCADFFIVGSPVETQCLAAVEACLCDTPVIMRSVGILKQFSEEERRKAGVIGDDLASAVADIKDLEFSPREVILSKGLTVQDSMRRWRVLLEEVFQEIATERARSDPPEGEVGR